MDDIICIILIFFLLGLFLKQLMPMIEGLDCDNGYRYDPKGEPDCGNNCLSDSEQKDYNNRKANKNENYLKDAACLSSLINKNSASVKSFSDKEYKNFSGNLDTKLIPQKTEFEESEEKFDQSHNALVEATQESDKEEDKDKKDKKKCGEMSDDTGAMKKASTGKKNKMGGGVDSKGNDCN